MSRFLFFSLLKIWNVNKYTGVLGVYNCQGAAWNRVERKNTFHQTKTESLTGHVRGSDVHLIAEAAMDPEWTGDCAIYSHKTGELTTLSYNVAMPVSLKVLQYEIFTITPIKVLAPGCTFAPLGLIDMYNAGGAIEGLKYEVKAGGENLSTPVVAVVSIEVKGCGRFGAYSSAPPTKCTVAGSTSSVDFGYDSASGLVTLNLADLPPEEQKVHIIQVYL